MMSDIFAHILPLRYMETVKRLTLINPGYTNRTLSLSDLDDSGFKLRL